MKPQTQQPTEKPPQPKQPTTRKPTENPKPSDTLDLLIEWFTEMLDNLKFTRGDPETRAIELMRCFSGIAIHFPGMPDIERLVRNRDVGRVLEADPCPPEHMRRLADKYSIDKRCLAKIYRKATGHGIQLARETRKAAA